MTKKVLVTGGSGFIAKNIFENLKDKYDFYTPGRKELDVLDSESVFSYIKKNNFDVVINAVNYDAAPNFTTKEPNKVLEMNLRMFSNVARCGDYFDKMIFFGSGAEFDRDNWKSLMDEDYFDKHVPKDQYGLSKYMMTKHAQASNNVYNLRLFAVFGKYDDWRYRFISNISSKAALGMPIHVKQDSLYDFLYIDDLVKVIEWFIENKPKKNVYNVCHGRPFAWREVAEKVVKISSKDLEITVGGSGREYSGDNSLLLNEIKDLTLTPIDVSLRNMYKWYEENKHILKEEILLGKKFEY